MGEDEYDEFEVETEDDGEGEYTGVNGSPYEARRNNKYLVFASFLELFQNFAESFSVFFGGLKTASLQRYCWQQERQSFFEEAGPQIERLTALENAEVKDASAE
jgi:hypothetical protein